MHDPRQYFFLDIKGWYYYQNTGMLARSIRMLVWSALIKLKETNAKCTRLNSLFARRMQLNPEPRDWPLFA